MADPVRRDAARVATLVALPVAVLVALLSLWALGGLERAENVPTGPTTVPPASPGAAVPLPARSLRPETAEVCRALVAALPDAIPGRARRPVSAGAEQNAAYGEPPVTLACGTPPASYPPTAELDILSGVCWYAQPGPTGTLWTTVDRMVPVTVTVPGPLAGSAQSVIPFSRAIAGGDPRTPAAPC
jgi:hypothetical protein